MVAAMLMAQQTAAAPREAGLPPDADFLEFLGSWHTGDDKWIAPFQEDDLSELEVEEQTTEQPPRDVGERPRGPRGETNPSPRYQNPDSPHPREGVKP